VTVTGDTQRALSGLPTGHSVIDPIGPARLSGASLNAIPKALNEAGARSPRGGAWTATAVRRVLARTVTI
jgi:hypothetical protein